ncbi:MULTISPECIES: FadR/GntR family transcriptional regulator [Streptomyces]|uniref:FadR/GntR family transcriptional regulator n=1 Tax=Streptomyces caniscabiei TaxID=2746961 RepID=A0ABU4MHS2_9ACTN|nr:MULTISPECIES: FadR/GntR family transcriptional regulator [Streptomyces]MBE4736475.1 FadR family transcriptional regulator [Streptomyces caniscabiei]MBE4760705.1 FadR family transcriptional regulator [Streptomyces caniscabiei]MBE4770399.1 FadR family transcriptional regulator [Streptomyces caniscabiei]MBE4786498.1 FadR family transcriptional regulator [Streptomyces caniscabiei]MBE4796627.1 FadR family transcriptional regulator [Streptomyces caniscabiei]
MTTPGRGLHGRVLETLGPAITAGEYPPGSVLRTDELAQTFEVSRSVMREAVRVLESMHLVESRRRVGVIVRPPAEWNVYDPQVIRWRLDGADRPRQLRSLTVLRSAIEPIAAGLAARHATAEQCAALTECAIGMVAHSRGHKLEGYLRHDVAFHRLILDASGNEMFARLGDVVEEVLAGRTHHAVMFHDPDPAAVTLHVQVAEAIREHDAPRAERLTREITVGALQELDILAPNGHSPAAG